jgi:DNA repair protein RadA/Sms
VALGEVGLGGEIRQVAHAPRRLAEAARLGYRQALVPATGAGGEDLAVTPVATLREALHHALDGEGARLRSPVRTG